MESKGSQLSTDQDEIRCYVETIAVEDPVDTLNEIHVKKRNNCCLLMASQKTLMMASFKWL